MAWSILLQIAAYNNHINLNKKTKFCDLDSKVKGQNQKLNISFCYKFMMSKITSLVNFGVQVVYMDIGESP